MVFNSGSHFVYQGHISKCLKGYLCGLKKAPREFLWYTSIMNEGIPNQEVPSRVEVIDSLLRNPEDFSLLIRYIDDLESHCRNSADSLRVHIDKAEILLAASHFDGAYEAFLDARDMAYQEGDNELAERMDQQAEKLNGLP